MTLRRPLVPTLVVLCLTLALTSHFLPPDASADDGYQEVAQVVSRPVWDRMRPIHRQLIRSIVENNLDPSRARMAACWEASPSNYELVEAFNAAMSLGADPSQEFQLSNRWTNTTSGTSGVQGVPTTLTYSFVPDGTSIPSTGTTDPSGVSNLFAWLNGIYGSPAVWQQIFADEFARYANLTGLSYVHETNDDGVPMFGSGGSAGSRGDVRIGARMIDGNSNILAFNFFPNNGDMVLDSSDSFYNNTTNSSRRLRNVFSHEHGHGLGMDHVCPIETTKLMEPFYTGAFLGPQHDDLLGAQRGYGDRFETNDTSGTATNFGTLGAGTISQTQLSIDDNSDTDWFRFTVNGSFAATVTVNPSGLSYQQGPQTQACNTGTVFDSLTQQDLSVELFAPNGSTVLASASSQPAGVAEMIPSTPLSSGPGTYFIRVSGGGANTIQIYQMALGLTVFNPPPFDIQFPNGLPLEVMPDQTFDLDVQVTAQSGTPDLAAAQLFTSVDGGAFQGAGMVDLGGGLLRGVLPAASCFQSIDFYVRVPVMNSAQVVTSPFNAPATRHHTEATASLVAVFADNFQTNMGWTVVNDPTLTGGAWGRGVPVGGGDRGDPATDGDGSGACFLTENVDGNSDVDGGATRLISPVIDLSLYPDARISWLFWYDNAAGGNPNSDVFVTEITNNGINWQLVESYNANAQAWLSRSLQVSDFVTPSSSVQIRFTASDPAPNGSVVEAGIDGFAVDACPAGGLGFCANGMVGFAQGGPFDVIFVDGSAGGSDRRATVPMGSAYSVSMNDVPGLFTNMPFVIFGTLGEPLPNSEFSLGPLVGSLCFTPCVAQPFDPNLFLLADTVGIGGCQPILPSNPTPWSFTIPPFPFAYTMTLQPVVQATSLFVWVGNAVVIDYGM